MMYKTTDTNMYDVIIIGAGVSGLSAADWLIKSGHTNVCVIEAMDRIGGRVNTVQFGHAHNEEPSVVELGANWIHGPDNNPVCELGMTECVLQKPFTYIDRSGHLVRTEDGNVIDFELSKNIWKNVKRIGAEHINTSERTWSSETGSSLLDYLRIRFHQEVDRLPADKQKMALSVYQSALNYSSFHEGDDISKVSPSCMGPEDFNGGDVKIPGGYINIFKALTKKFNESTLKLNSVVKKVYLDKESGAVRIKYSHNKKDVEVCCKFVILTVSVGVLKKIHMSLFKPQLPAEKVTAINRIGFGNVEKIFLYYNTPFWAQGQGSFKTAWHNGRYDQQELTSWYKCIFGFEEVLDNPNVLAAWVSGSGARTMTSLTDKEVIDVCTSLLRSFLADQNIPTPSKMLRSRWSKNERVLGSYSYMNSEHYPDDVTSISQPVLDSLYTPRILFAGEATHEYYGTTHGALLSGRREAKRVLDFM